MREGKGEEEEEEEEEKEEEDRPCVRDKRKQLIQLNELVLWQRGLLCGNW